jgi:predicted nucleic acid-binding protein
MIGIDSDCIIDFLKGKEEAVKVVEENKHQLITTEINIFEIYFGIFNKLFISEKELNSANGLFESINNLPFKNNCGKRAAEIITSLIKKGKIIQQNDSMIASILLENKIESIITKNVKHFSLIKGLKIINY